MGICATCSRDLSRKCSELEGKAAALKTELTETVAKLKGKDDELAATSRTMAGDQMELQRLEDELKVERAERRAAEEALARSSERSEDPPEVMEVFLTTSDRTEGENGHAGGRMTKSLIDLQDEETQKDKGGRRQSIGHGMKT